MKKRILTGNEAVALGALKAGVHVATGYPGTPSTGCVGHLLTLDLAGRYVEWGTNEKVAFEVASGAAWAGQRALVTMKMSGVNVAYDALISIAYSGTNGGFVIYVADDPGVSAGMPEQDSRGFALMSDLPMLEPDSPGSAYKMVQQAFELSEAVGSPVFLRSTTAVALTHEVCEIDDLESLIQAPEARHVLLEKDIARYTKAGAKICKDQHAALIDRLDCAQTWVHEHGLNALNLAGKLGGVGIVSVGAANAYLTETLALVEGDEPSMLKAAATIPFPQEEIKRMLEHCGSILVLEELEPHLERGVHVLARKLGFQGPIVGKLDGTLSRIGEYGIAEVLKGLSRILDVKFAEQSGSSDAIQPQESAQPILERTQAESVCSPAPRPITVCAGCPHRGSYMAIESAIRKAGFKKDEVMVTGDIGCTILGMNPPFDLLWNEVSMGSSVSLAQGYVHAGIQTPVIATIGDSTFFHGGIPGLLNAVQHNTPLTLVVMDNGWTSMTGMQVNPGTAEGFQPKGGRRIDLAQIIPALGVDHFEIVDPFDQPAMTEVMTACLAKDGVKVILARQECAIQARRQGRRAGTLHLDPDACILCNKCLRVTGCPALSVGENSIVIDQSLCYGCGMCASVCPTQALTREVSA